MKRLTIEQAENLPMKEGINKRHLPEGYWASDNRTCDKMNPRIIRRFILKYVNKKFDDCYSDFIHKTKTLHISNNLYLDEIKRSFNSHFSNRSEYYSPYMWYDFTINPKGIIIKNIRPAKKHPEIGVTTLYKLDMNRLMQENYDLYKYAERNRSYKFRSTGLTSDELRHEFFFDDLKNRFSPYIVTVKVGTPLKGKDLIRYYRERWDLKKYQRDLRKRHYYDIVENNEKTLLDYLQEGKRSRRIKREQDPTYKEFTKNVLGL